MAFIKVKEYEEADEELRSIYDDILRKRGNLAEIHKLQSLHPASIPQHMDFYMELMFSRSPLKRAQREMIAVVVSGANQCNYCVQHHGSALQHFWKAQEKVDQLSRNFRELDLKPEEKALCEYAEALTVDPRSIDEATTIRALKEAGWDDRAILDAAMITSYFNFVNRMVLGLGAELEEDKGTDYYYE